MTDEQIIELFGQVPYFADHIIERPQHLKDEQLFVTDSYWSPQASINLLDVRGTQHPDYAGLSWRQFLSKGRRMDSNIRSFQKNPDYYLKIQERVPSMHYHKVDNLTYVTDDGNHRTCIGKFFLYAQGQSYIHGVHFSESIIDWHYFALYHRFLAVKPENWRVEVRRDCIQRDDGAGWRRDYFRPLLKCSKYTKGLTSDWIWSREELEDEVQQLEWAAAKEAEPVKRSFWEKLFGVKK
jgi:hypothetical protein